MTIQTLTTLLLGAGGGTTIFSLLLKWKDANRKARVEDEDTMVKRLEAENRRALQRADEAEQDADRYRQERNAALEKASELRRHVIELGGEVERDA
jgi:hypothetical protein